MLKIALPIALATAGALVVLIRRRWVVVTVVGTSMTPTLRPGQRVVARRVRRNGFGAGDIVVFRPPESGRRFNQPEFRVKRVAALEGDPIPSWMIGVRGTDGVNELVPHGHVVVSGDANDSEDSRQLGYIDCSDIVALVRRG